MRYVFVMSLMLNGLVTGSAEAAANFERESLHGLAEIFVIVEVSTPDPKSDGLSEQAIRTAAEVILRSSGIRVLTEEEGRTGPSAAILNINTNAVKSNNVAVYGFNVTVVLYQQVRLGSRPEVETPAITWGKSITGAVDPKLLKAHVIHDVESIAKEFATDFLSVNSQ